MQSFLHLITSMPVMPFTVLLGVVLCYWVLVIAGAVGIDGLDSGADGVTGAVKSLGADALDAGGAIKGAGEAVVGSVKAVKGAADDGGLLSVLGIGRIPITITFSTLAFFGWVLTIALSRFADGGWLKSAAILAGALVVSLFTTSLALRPLAKVFEPARAVRRSDLLGRVCIVTSGRVDERFGSGSIDDGGAGLILHLKCERPNQLKKGDRVVIIDYDAATDTYDVEPIDWLTPAEADALADPARAASVLATRVRSR